MKKELAWAIMILGLSLGIINIFIGVKNIREGDKKSFAFPDFFKKIFRKTRLAEFTGQERIVLGTFYLGFALIGLGLYFFGT
jgi:hypothetical protein